MLSKAFYSVFKARPSSVQKLLFVFDKNHPMRYCRGLLSITLLHHKQKIMKNTKIVTAIKRLLKKFTMKEIITAATARAVTLQIPHKNR